MSEHGVAKVKHILVSMGLNEYQASVLAYLLYMGETKASTLSKASGVPSSRIYDVLDELAKAGLIVVRPGRPTTYAPRSPEDVASALVSAGIRELKERLLLLEQRAKELVEAAKAIYLKGSKAREARPLLRIVGVGRPSLEETRKLYKSAAEEILIISKAFEYFPEVADALEEAAKRGVRVRIVLVSPDRLSEQSREKQSEIIRAVRDRLGDNVEIRFFPELPLRGCIVDPKSEGKALFLVEEPGIPLFLREAAITTHHNLVKALAIMFSLVWEKASPTP